MLNFLKNQINKIFAKENIEFSRIFCFFEMKISKLIIIQQTCVKKMPR